MKNRNLGGFCLVLMLGLMLLFAGCQDANVAEEEEETATTTTVVDSRGVSVEIEYPADNVVCLLNSGLNDLYMLGAGDVVTGIDQWTYDNTITYNVLSGIDERIAEKTLPAVDDNVENIVALNPDVVIIWAGNEDQIAALEEQGIKVVGIQVNSFDDVVTKLEMIAQIVGKEDRAQEIIAYTDQQLQNIADQTATLSQDQVKSGIFVWGASKLDLAGNTSTGDSLLGLCGITNAAADVEEEHFVAKMEDVISWNPDAIVMWNIADLDPADYVSDSQWADIAAVQNGDVYEIPDELTFYCDLWTVKYVYAVEYMAKNVYGDLFADVDIDAAKDEMMNFLYGTTAE